MKTLKLIYFLLFLGVTPFAQKNDSIPKELLGRWEGALIKNNSYQKIELEVFENEGRLVALEIVEEWSPSFGEFHVLVRIDSLGKIRFSTGYGKAVVSLDKENLELVGQLEDHSPATYVHLKKLPPRSKINYAIEAVEVESNEAKIKGYLHLPKVMPKKTAIIIVGGRGCWEGDPEFNLYGKFLREYGVAVLAYHKRGTGESTGSCEESSIEDLAKDLAELHRFLKEHPAGFEKIGVLGSSAGGWVMTKAEEYCDFDFMVSVVGPSTSVREQQLQSGAAGAEDYELSKQALENLSTYTNLMFDAPANNKGFKSMQKLLENAESEGWRDILEETDIPNSIEEMPKLWVRRHAFDPQESLKNFKHPFLAFYGTKDWIVPVKENTERLEECFQGKEDLLTVIPVHEAGHSMEVEEKQITLSKNESYWRFFRVSPVVKIELINFLSKHNLL